MHIREYIDMPWIKAAFAKINRWLKRDPWEFMARTTRVDAEFVAKRATGQFLNIMFLN